LEKRDKKTPSMVLETIFGVYQDGFGIGDIRFS
jgi:hypothetical protein